MKLIVGKEFKYNDIVPAIYSLPHPFLEPFKVISINRNNTKPKISAIVPVFNKEKIITIMLDKLIESLTLDYELIIIDDASTDNSKEIINNYLKYKNVNHLFISTTVPIFETGCDNLGFFLAAGSYLLEVQSDIIINDKGFDKRMISALDNNKFCSVSGRSCHSWFDLLDRNKKITNILKFYSPLSLILFGTGAVGYVGKKLYDGGLTKGLMHSDVYHADTNCRGPWLTSKSLLNEIGPFNTNNFFLGFDDHDFNLRGSKLGYRAGFTPVLQTCDKNNSSSFKKKEGINQKVYDYLAENKQIHSFKKIFGSNEFINKIAIEKATRPKKI
jgi:glycosyltransferase involved in cell wall biosynthesis